MLSLNIIQSQAINRESIIRTNWLQSIEIIDSDQLNLFTQSIKPIDAVHIGLLQPRVCDLHKLSLLAELLC